MAVRRAAGESISALARSLLPEGSDPDSGRRWVKRRLEAVRRSLAPVPGFDAARFAGCHATVVDLRDRLATRTLLMDLRGLLTPYLCRLSRPLGFCHARIVSSLIVLLFVVVVSALPVPALAGADPGVADGVETAGAEPGLRSVFYGFERQFIGVGWQRGPPTLDDPAGGRFLSVKYAPWTNTHGGQGHEHP